MIVENYKRPAGTSRTARRLSYLFFDESKLSSPVVSSIRHRCGRYQDDLLLDSVDVSARLIGNIAS